MSFLGIDLGTTGCKAVIFDKSGVELASAYREYLIESPVRGYAELNTVRVWERVKELITECISGLTEDVVSVSVSSLGEAMVPVTSEREPLGNSLLNYDSRGSAHLYEIRDALSDKDLYEINGNAPGPNYSLTRLLWYQKEHCEIYDKADKFLPWGSFILYMMGAEPVIDYSLANRTLLLDINRKEWNSSLIDTLGLSVDKLPRLVEAGTACGRMPKALSDELGFKSPPLLVAGAHDQCANALGCGVIDEGRAMYGMGTFHCIVSVFGRRPDSGLMLQRGLNTEHHAIPDRWVSFIYNQGGMLLKWFRDTFAADIADSGKDIYQRLLEEMPDGPSPVSVLPHLTTTGPPGFIEKTSGLISGLTADTSRGDICKGVLEGIAFYLKENLDNLPEGMNIDEFTAVGGGSRSDIWMQLTADLFNKPCRTTAEPEAGALGAAMLATIGAGHYGNIREAIEQMVCEGQVFTPSAGNDKYLGNYNRYKSIAPLFGDFLAGYKRQV